MQRSFFSIWLVLGLSLILGCSTSPKRPVVSEDAKLHQVIATFTEARKRLDAFSAPYFNLEADLDKFGDFLSAEQLARGEEMYRTALSGLNQIDIAGLSPKERMAYRLFRGDVESSLEHYRYPFHLFSFNQMGNRFREYIDDTSPDLASFPYKTVAHYRAFVRRSEGFLPFVDRQIANLEEGVGKGYALNCAIAKNAIGTYKDGLEPNIPKHPFYRPIKNLPATFSSQEKAELRAAFRAMIAERILPGFRKFDAYYRTQYLPKCRQSYGIGGLPQGKEMYRLQVRASTDVELDAKSIHETGLQEVARIRSEIEAVKLRLGFNQSFDVFLRQLTRDEKSYFRTSKDLFGAFNAFRASVDRKIADAFVKTPRAEFRIVSSENPEDPAASYHEPTEYVPHGRFVVNTKNLKGVPKFGVNTLFLHEAVPGHHFHLALQFEMKDELSEYQRKMFSSTAFAEGWALYAERWGREVGLVEDPWQLLGSLSDEMLRAVRLVVDTGIHEFGWSREKAIQFMTAHLAADPKDIQIEADRYSVWPGQALAYKVGQLKILELRERARKEMGERFNLKDFHRVVLGSGTVSLPVLESNVDAWIRQL